MESVNEQEDLHKEDFFGDPNYESKIIWVNQISRVIPRFNSAVFDSPTQEMKDHLKPLLLTLMIEGHEVNKVLVDEGAAINILSQIMLKRFGKTLADLKPHNILISDYAGKSSQPEGMILLDVQIGSVKRTTMFIFTPSKANFNVLLGREWIHKVGVVPSTLHQKVFFWNDDEHLEVLEADQKEYETARILAYMAERIANGVDECDDFEMAQGGIQREKDEETTGTKAKEKEENQKDQYRKKALKTSEKESLEIKIGDEQSRVSERGEERLNCVFDDAPLGFEKGESDELKVESQDPLEEVNLGTIENRRITYINKLAKESFKEQIVRVLHEYRNGTKHLHHHLDICVLKKASTSGKGGQTMFFSKVLGLGKKELACGSYNEENARRELALMYIARISTFNSGPYWICMICSNNSTIISTSFKKYNEERDTNERRVTITSDMWTTSNQKKGYMAITTHYIDGNWTLQSIILRFVYVPAPHTADRLCNVLIDCLLDWNLDTKLSTITLDNCSTNDSMIEKIKDKLQLDRLIHNGSLLHMCCYAHILNLIVKEGLGVVKEGVEKNSGKCSIHFFPKICEIKLAIDEWVKSPNQIIHNMAKQMLNKFESYWRVIHDIKGVASVLDPRYKMDLLEYYFDKLYDIDCDLEISRIRQLCYDLVSEYQAKKNERSSFGFSSFEEGNVGDNGMSDFMEMYNSSRVGNTYLPNAHVPIGKWTTPQRLNVGMGRGKQIVNYSKNPFSRGPRFMSNMQQRMRKATFEGHKGNQFLIPVPYEERRLYTREDFFGDPNYESKIVWMNQIFRVIPKFNSAMFDSPTQEMKDHLKPLLLTLMIEGFEANNSTNKVLVDGGAAINILPQTMLKRFGKTLADLKPHNILISNYAGKSSQAEGMILLDVQIGSVKRTTMFIVTPSKANFNVLLGREWIHGVGAVPSIVHQKVFFWNDDEHLERLDADQKEYQTGMYFADQQITTFVKTKPFDALDPYVLEEEEGVKKTFC
uniref:AC transposase n=1 Tax=Cajanus cajan TaxID=3821 RepID=A0A151RG51_CAJCA|nr:Putative AC transposase [Cajanus cajan]